MKTGLVSITFRKLSVDETILLVKQAELDAIEWGGDIHVPHGDVKKAEEVREKCKKNGIEISAYGSYYSIGENEKDISFETVLRTAKALNAPLIRVWAGSKNPDQADSKYIKMIMNETERISKMADEYNIKIACEFHAHTLTQTNESTLDYLNSVKSKNFFTYWQPPVNMTDEDCINGIRLLKDRIINLHVFQWEGTKRCTLETGKKRWIKFISEFDKGECNRCALLEFVKDDNPKQFIADAKVLKDIIGII